MNTTTKNININIRLMIRSAIMCFLPLLSGYLNAAIIASYDFQGSVSTSTDVDPDTTASEIFDFDGNNENSGDIGLNVRYGGFLRGNPEPSLLWTAANFNDATLLDEDYLTFTLTPSSVNVQYTSLVFDFKAGTAVDTDIIVFSSQSGFASLGDAVDTYSQTSSSTQTGVSMDLSSMSVGSAPTTFRLYFQTVDTNGTREYWIDNIVLNGNISAIPEPSTLVLMGLVGLASMGLLRRRK